MNTALRDRPGAPRPADTRPADGGLPARRVVIRWAWRLFRREWRQQLLVLALLTVAIAATTAGLGIVTNVLSSRADAVFGTANRMVILSGSDQTLAADIAAAKSYFGTVDVIEHEKIAVPGSASTIDMRAQDPRGAYGYPTVRLDAGRYPTAPNDVAVTRHVAALFDLHVGGSWQEDGRTLTVVGLVENPVRLLDDFALVAPGQLKSPSNVAILLQTSEQRLRSFHFADSAGPIGMAGRSTTDQRNAAIAVLVFATIALVFVGLLAVGGFAVLSARRQRALGMLGAIGASDRHVRLVMLANGAAVGVTGAAVGAAVGLASWFAVAPRLEGLAEHRIDRFDLPWWAIAAAMLLASLTAVVAAWWPARAAARLSIVAALSGRPPRPRPAHRFALLGVLLVAGGIVLLAFSHQRRPGFIVPGIVATAVGVLFLAPLAIRGLAAIGTRAPIAVRLALRDLSRYRARSGAAVGAITLAVGIAATIAVTATASAFTSDASASGVLPKNQLIVRSSEGGGPIPQLTAAQVQAAQTQVNAIAASVGSHDVLALDEAVDPAEPVQNDPISGVTGRAPASMAKATNEGGKSGFEFLFAVYVATPAVLAHYGISPDRIDPTADILSSRTPPAGQVLIVRESRGGGTITPKVQRVPLPTYTSSPNTLITAHAMQRLGLQGIPAAWLVQAPRSLTSAQVDAAQKLAAAGGLTVETSPAQANVTQLRIDATTAGVLVALGILAMTIGLIRSETAADLRTLSATGASESTRRALTGATAGGLALLGGLLGTAGAYAALLAWDHNNLSSLRHVPAVDLVVLLVGLPLVAVVGGWLLGGHEPPAVARRPLE